MTENYFSEPEQACRCCGKINNAEGFLDKLNILRAKVGIVFKITSMNRCESHNKEVGGKPNSFHLITHPWGCCAADVSIAGWSSQNVWRLVEQAMIDGWSVGVNFQHQFLHFDRRMDYPEAGWKSPIFFPYY